MDDDLVDSTICSFICSCVGTNCRICLECWYRPDFWPLARLEGGAAGSDCGFAVRIILCSPNDANPQTAGGDNPPAPLRFRLLRLLSVSRDQPHRMEANASLYGCRLLDSMALRVELCGPRNRYSFRCLSLSAGDD